MNDSASGRRQSAEVTAGEAGLRLDVYLVRALPGTSRRLADRLIREGRVLLNDRPARKGCFLAEGDRVSLPVVYSQTMQVDPEPDLPLTVLYEDRDVLVVEKPAGIHTHPLVPGEKGTLAGALVARYPGISRVGFSMREPGVLHRLDKGTSGALLVARNAHAFEHLRRQFAEGRVEKIYLAVVHGRTPKRGSIELALVKSGPRGEKMMAVEPEQARRAKAWPAQTRFRTLEARAGFSLCEVKIRTGARHQVRVHLAHIGHPVAGDAMYGASPAPEDRLIPDRHLLHAWKISFDHPRNPGRIHVKSEMPVDMKAFWEGLEPEKSSEQ